MMDRRRFVVALSALLISGTINPELFDSKLSYSTATPGEYKVTIHHISKLPTVTMKLHRTTLVKE